MALGQLQTTKTVRQTMQDLKAEFTRWGVTKWDAPHPEKVGGTDATVRFEVGKESKVLRCQHFDSYAVNLRALFLTVEALRKADQRGIMPTLREYFLQLPAPRSCYDILAISPNASLEEARAAFLRLAREHHPDVGGSDQEMADLNRAMAEFEAEWERRHA